MNIIQANNRFVLIIEPRVFKNSRSYLFESSSHWKFDEKVTPVPGHSFNFVQEKESMSSYVAMRDLYYQRMPFTHS